MFPYTPKPIRRIGKIRFAPMHDAMDVGPIRIFYSLRDNVRRFQVVVPKQRQCPNKLLVVRWQCRAMESLVQRLIQFPFGLHAYTWPRPKLGRLGGSKQLRKGFWHGHGSKMA